MISVLIPSRNSPFCKKTVEDVLKNAKGEVEVIVNVDEKWPELVQDKRVTYIHPSNPVGLREGVNACAKLAKGEYIMKTDDHCMFAPGFDLELTRAHLRDNWIQVPRRYSLDAENWQINTTRPFRDYMYLCFPLKGKAHDWGSHGVEWWERQRERSDPKYDYDDTPSMQGSCYFMTRNHFVNVLGGLQETGYGQFAQESQEIGNKTWLGGGALRVNKKTWYAHLHKGKQYGRMYKIDGFNDETIKGSNWSAYHWLNNEEAGMKHKFEWLVNNKFKGMPTWESNWQEIWDKQVKEGWPNATN